MDRISPSEGGDTGSIPVGSTKNNTRRFAARVVFSPSAFYARARRIMPATRDFLRLAVLSLITPRLHALSIAAYTAGRSFSASATSRAASAFVNALTVSRIASLRRRLKTRFFAEERIAFFAELVIAMSAQSTANARELQVCATGRGSARIRL